MSIRPSPAPVPVILASASPRRRDLLRALLSQFEVVPSGVDEILPPGVPAVVVAERLALDKARWVARQFGRGLILAADTVIGFDGRIIGKPGSPAEALEILTTLAGNRHDVITGVAIVDAADGGEWSSAVTSEVFMNSSSPEELERYVLSGEPLDKAGAYAIQGLGAGLVSRFQGCFSNIVGLPLCETARLLTAAGSPEGGDWRVCRMPGGAPCPRADAWTTQETSGSEE